MTKYICKIQDVLEIEWVALPSSICFPIYCCWVQYLFGSYSVLVQGVNDPWHKYQSVKHGRTCLICTPCLWSHAYLALIIDPHIKLTATTIPTFSVLISSSGFFFFFWCIPYGSSAFLEHRKFRNRNVFVYNHESWIAHNTCSLSTKPKECGVILCSGRILFRRSILLLS